MSAAGGAGNAGSAGRARGAAPSGLESSRQRVVLVGMMGSGKTSVGRALARATGWAFLDNDALVQRATGRSAPALLHERGEDALREAEAAALGEGLAVPPPVILDVAGGVVTRARDRDRLRDVADRAGREAGIVVWLRARVETLARRVGTGAGRAWLDGDPETALRRLYAGREPLYAEVATDVVDVDDRGPEQVADRIIAALLQYE